MSTKTGIAWCDTTWNPIVGCSKVSAGCLSCYAVKEVRRLAGNPHPKIAHDFGGLVAKHANGQLDWTGTVRLLPARLEQPLHWTKPRRVFVNSLSDLFHEAVTVQEMEQIFEVMISTPHTYQVLTKRPERMARFVQYWLGHSLKPQILEDIWLGTSVEDRLTAAQRIPWLQQTPAVIRFLSLEPLLEDLGALDLQGISWVIVGGESGPKARRCAIAWIENIVAQCHATRVPVFVKQLGSNSRGTYDVTLHWQDRKGSNPEEWPEPLRVQQFPQHRY